MMAWYRRHDDHIAIRHVKREAEKGSMPRCGKEKKSGHHIHFSATLKNLALLIHWPCPEQANNLCSSFEPILRCCRTPHAYEKANSCERCHHMNHASPTVCTVSTIYSLVPF